MLFILDARLQLLIKAIADTLAWVDKWAIIPRLNVILYSKT
jgi:hypothetical protein